MSELCLSYHPDDAAFALKLAADLRNMGVRLWVDVFQSPEQPTDKVCIGTIAVLSPGYVAEKMADLSGAEMVFPVIVTPVLDWPEVLPRESAIDFSNAHSYEEQFAVLLNELRKQAATVIGDRPDAIEHYLNGLMARAGASVVNYVPLAVYAEPAGRDEKTPMITLSADFRLPGDDADKEAEQAAFDTLPDIQLAVARHPSCVVLGAAGAGKTTALQQLVIEAVWRYQEGPYSNPLPVLVDLAVWPEGMSFNEFLVRNSPAAEQIVVYADNFNAISRRRRQIVEEWLLGFEGDVIIACRAASYDNELSLSPVIFAPLGVEHVRQIVDAYLHDDEAAAFLMRVLPSVEAETDIVLPMAAVPLLLVAMIRVYQYTGEMPVNTGALLRAYTRRMWEPLQYRPEWTVYEEMAAKLGWLALRMFDDDETGDVDVTWAAVQISDKGRWRRGGPDKTALALLALAGRAELLTMNDDMLRFSHHLIQSYFAALALREQGIGASLEPPVFSSDDFRRLPSKWDQAVIMLSHLVDDPASVLMDVVKHDPYLAADCVVSGVQVPAEAVDVIRKALAEQLTGGDMRITQTAVEILRRLGETELVMLAIEDLIGYGNHYLRRVGAWILGEVRHPAGIPILIELMRDVALRETASEALVKIGPAVVPEVVLLLDNALEDRWETRSAAAQILKAIGDPAAIQDLLDTLYDDEHAVRWSVANALVSMGAAVVPGLLEVVNDPDSLLDDEGDTCRAAACTLVWVGNEAAVTGLLEALRDVDPNRRGIVAEALGEIRYAQVVVGLAERLMDHAMPDWGDETVGQIAALALRRIGTPEALEALKRH